MLNLIFFDLAHYLRRAEVPLLTDNLAKRVPIGRPAQDELLRARDFIFFKHKRYLFQPVRLVEYEPDRLSARICCAPASGLFRNEDRLDWIVFLLRGNLNNRSALDVQPALNTGSHSLCSLGDKTFPHIKPVYLSTNAWQLSIENTRPF